MLLPHRPHHPRPLPEQDDCSPSAAATVAYDDDDDKRMLAWPRLPTPAPPADAPVSPLTIRTTPLSAGTSSYTVADGLLPSPLPSPRKASLSSSGGSGKSKTAAFFGSPFAAPGPPTPAPPPPPPAPTRRETPKHDVDASSPPPVRSATADFFATSTTGYRPTPPPSVKSSASSREASPPRLPPLSRFFPSRYSADPTLALAEGDEEDADTMAAVGMRLRKGGADWETSFKREFLQLTEAAAQSVTQRPCSPLEMERPVPPMSMPVTPPGAGPRHRGLPVAHTPHALLTQQQQHHQHHTAPHHEHPVPVRRETHVVGSARGSGDSGFEEALPLSPPVLVPVPASASAMHAGAHLESGSAALRLVRALGEGAFSSVWLAEDVAGTLAAVPASCSLNGNGNGNGNVRRAETGLRRKSSSWAKRSSDDTHMEGIRPTPSVRADTDTGFAWDGVRSAEGSVMLDEQDGEGASSSTNASVVVPPTAGSAGRLVAVKMMNRAMCDSNDRTRISFVREVEVLRHIAHPSIVAYLHSFTTATHHCLVLEHVAGGELFELVNSDVQYARVTEPAVRRMWGELCRAVGWMHGVSLVHRDIKLENILLTRNIFARGEPLPPLHTPLIKLTDFGLSRFVDPAAPLLSTRCGSESYAAPELVLGAGTGARAVRQNSGSESDASGSASASAHAHAHAQDAPRGYYDGRQTDAWACGVVLYALATRQLPFDAPPPPTRLVFSGPPSCTGSVRSARSVGSRSVRSARAVAASRRRDVLMRIAQGEYYWPDEYEVEVEGDEEGEEGDNESTCALEGGESDEGEGERERERDESSPAATARRLASAGLKRVVARLLERSTVRRARLGEVWGEEWMKGEGAVGPPVEVSVSVGVGVREVGEGEEGGVLIDEEHIGSVACQEVDPL
ncbi:hypothetical protein M0805_007735 [Coniferiporia weirii]|nr:hypothetical protein M0805_007735 [Coniferiporia weirii]